MEARLYQKLWEYSQSGSYPFHMPGHKRNHLPGIKLPYELDITEIHGFDDLHHAQGILKESMEWAAKEYKSAATWYLVNGSTCGNLAAVHAAVEPGISLGREVLLEQGKPYVLAAENCHKSVFHALELKNVPARILPVRQEEGREWKQDILPEVVEQALSTVDCANVRALVLTSPTYEGYVSRIWEISQICHKRNCICIVDEAHGAHFPYHERFPKSALYEGADLVVQSLHKTLPSLTQTALLHLSKEGEQRFPGLREAIEKYLRIFQSSSPSYLLLASIEECLHFMKEKKEELMPPYIERMDRFYEKMQGLTHLFVLPPEKNRDLSKVIICTGEQGSGPLLKELLRIRCGLEMELCGRHYVLAMTSCMDTEDGLNRLADALLELDSFFKASSKKAEPEKTKARTGTLDVLVGQKAKENIYIYPPGIPIIRRGEPITEEAKKEMEAYLEAGIHLYGIDIP